MKIAVLHGPRELALEEVAYDIDALAPDEIHVRTRVTAFEVGTDREDYEGSEPLSEAPTAPRWVGSSNLGVVEAVGRSVTLFSPDDRVLSRWPHQSEYVARETDLLVKVPPGVDDDDAVFGFVYTLSADCLRKAHFVPGETVAVVGLGVIGLGAVSVGAAFGARVLAVGNSPLRTEMARRIGAHAAILYEDPGIAGVVDRFTDGRGIDLVVLAANPWPAYRTAVEIVRRNGRVAIVAMPGLGDGAPGFNPLSIPRFSAKGISLVAVDRHHGAYYPSTTGDLFDQAHACRHTLQMMVDGRIAPKRLLTHRLSASRLAEAYEMAHRREKAMLGVVFDWTS